MSATKREARVTARGFSTSQQKTRKRIDSSCCQQARSRLLRILLEVGRAEKQK